MRNCSFKQVLLGGASAGVLLLALAEPSQAKDPMFNGGYMTMEGGLAFMAGDRTPYAEIGRSMPPSVLSSQNVGPSTGGRFGVGVGVNLVDRWDVGIFYSGLRSGRGSDVTAYYYTADGSGVYVYQVLGGGGTYGAKQATADADVNYHVIDFEAGHSMQLGGAGLRLFGGLRLLHINQEVEATFIAPALGVAPLFNNREVEFNGAGPRIGVNGDVPLGRGFSLVGGLDGALLFGGKRTRTNQIFPTPGGSINFDRENTHGQLVYNASGELGISFTPGAVNGEGPLVVTFGYLCEAWFGVNNTTGDGSLAGAANLAKGIRTYGDDDADQIFHGPFFRVTIHFN